MVRRRFAVNPGWGDIEYECQAVVVLAHNRPAEALAPLVDVVERLDDWQLIYWGSEILGILLEHHGDDVHALLVPVLESSARLRTALSCVGIEDKELEARLKALVRSDEEIENRPTTPRTPERKWTRTESQWFKSVRVPRLTAALANAARSGVANEVSAAEVIATADPGAGHLLWTRFRCEDEAGTAPTFYRCGVMLFGGPVSIEVDLLVSDVDVLDDAEPDRIGGLLQGQYERLPDITGAIGYTHRRFR